jgi:hypothetical protein
MVYSLHVITARNWSVTASIQDLKIFFRRDSGFVQPSLSTERKDHAPAEERVSVSTAFHEDLSMKQILSMISIIIIATFFASSAAIANDLITLETFIQYSQVAGFEKQYNQMIST